MKSKTQHGFGVLGVLAVLVVVGVVGFAGYKVYRSHQKSNTIGSTATNTKPSTEEDEETGENAKRLCYLKDFKAQCYIDATYTKVTPERGIDNLRIIKIVPSPKDTKLAIIAQVSDNAPMDIYTTDSSLKTSKVDLGSYTKNANSVAWLPDQSGIVFEVNPSGDSSKRVLVQYTFADKKFKQLTSNDILSMSPIVTDSSILFQQFDLKANPSTGWEWHKMGLDGSNNTDLGLNAGYAGVMSQGKLIDTKPDGTGLISFDIITKTQTPLDTTLTTLTTTGSGITTLGDGRIIYPYQSTPNQDGPNNRLAIVDLVNKGTVNIANTGAGDPFETSLLNK